MKIVVGLGNPEQKYNNTYHNLGFCFLDELAERLGVSVKKKDCNSLIGEAFVNGEKILLVKPQTYMNLSGKAVLGLKTKYKLDDSEIIVAVDDVDIEKGKFRYRESGSAGTHNGLRSIVEEIGSGFKRIRIGAKPNERPADLADYVLSKIDGESAPKMAEAIDNAIQFLLDNLL